MKMRLLPLAIAAAMVAPLPALALDEAAVMKRLEQLEAQRRADQAEIDALRQQVQQLQSNSSGSITSSEAQQLRAEIAKVDKRAGSRVASLSKAVDAEREKLRVNGFMSGYAVRTTDEAVRLGASGKGDEWNFQTDTVAGVQFSYQLDEKTDAVVQLIAQGKEGYDVDASWAFLRYAITPNTKIRAGRLATPLFLYTETIDVGFTYPWVRPPVEMYRTDASRYQGIDVTHDFNLFGWNSSLQAYFGDTDSAGVVDGKFATGLAATFNRDAWTLRAAYSILDFEITSINQSTKFEYVALAARYDDGNWLAIAEARQYKSDGDASSIQPSNQAFYGTLGYQFDRMLPYVTVAKGYSIDDGDALIKNSLQSVGFGLRYTLTDKVVLKGEATRYSDFDGTQGTDGLLVVPTNPIERANTLNGLDDDGATVMSFGFDAVF